MVQVCAFVSPWPTFQGHRVKLCLRLNFDSECDNFRKNCGEVTKIWYKYCKEAHLSRNRHPVKDVPHYEADHPFALHVEYHTLPIILLPNRLGFRCWGRIPTRFCSSLL